MKVIILSADTNGLGATRSLYGLVDEIIVISKQRHEPVNYSRYPDKKYILENADNETTALLDILNTYKNQRYVLIPTSDFFCSILYEYALDNSEQFLTLLPPSKLINTLIDKSKEVPLVQSTGIPTPVTITNIPKDIATFAHQIQFPVIIKPTSYKYHNTLGAKNIILKNFEDCEKFYTQFGANFKGLLAQEVIPGDDDAQWVCNCVFDSNYEIRSAMVFKRLKLAPAHFGVTSFAMSKQNATILNYAKKLGKQLHYQGAAMIEFKYDKIRKDFVYIELNPRLGLCNYFDTRSGVNTAMCLTTLASGKQINDTEYLQKEDVFYLSTYDDFYTRYKDGEKISTILKSYMALWNKKVAWAYHHNNDPLVTIVITFFRCNDTCRSLLRKFFTFRNKKRPQ